MGLVKFEPPATTIGRLLHFASVGDVGAVEKVLADSPGMPVDAPDYDGRTAMHLAASEGHSAVINALLEHKANVNPVDRWRKTPLADARRYEVLYAKGSKRAIYQDVCDLLVRSGGITSSPFEIDKEELKHVRKIRQCNFGMITLANWRRTNVQARVMERNLEALTNSPKSDPKLTKQLSLLQRLRHPNIVQFLGAVQTKSEPLVLVTEYLPKGDLSELLRHAKKGRLPQKEAMSYALDIARGMNYLHQHKPEQVVHSDLNPMNLLRDAGGHLKVAGLHLSKIEWICKHGNDASNDELLFSRSIEFAEYRAPELTSEMIKNLDSSVDVYSFGVIVREMFEGKSLASRQAQRGTTSRHGTEAEVAVSKLYPCREMEKLLKLCCARDPSKRPPFGNILLVLESANEAMLKKRLSTAIQGVVDNISPPWQFCIPPAFRPPKSRSIVYSAI